MSSRIFIERCLIGAGISFLGMAAICTLLYPQVFRHPDYGVSYFGSVHLTFIPFYLGFALTIIFTALAAKRLMMLSKTLSLAFWSFAVCMTGVAATSYSLNHTVYATHWGFAIALAICILTATIWLIVRGRLKGLDYAVAGLIIVTIVVSALPVVNDIPIVEFYIPRELLVFICSLWLLGHAALKLPASPKVS